MEFGLHWLDTTVIVLYFVLLIGYGLWLTKKIKTSAGYFIGERKFSWWIMMGQAFSAGTHAENFTAQTGASFNMGFASIWYQWKNMIITPFYWLIAPWYRRSDRTTVGEIVEDRYGQKMAVIYSLFAIFYFVFAQGVMLKGGGKVIAVAMGGNMSVDMVVLIMTATFIIYSFLGGMVASAHANFIQALMIIILSFMLIPSGLIRVGGFSGMREALPEDFFLLFNSDVGIGTFTLLMLAVNGFVGITAQPHMVSMCGTGNTERAGRVGQTYGTFVKRFVTIGWALTGLIVAALIMQNGQKLEDPEMAFGYATRELLVPGLVGLMIASIFAANMSSASNFMVNTGALFTQNFYKVFINKHTSDKQLLRMGRISAVALTLVGVGFAFIIENVLQAFLFMETTAAFMGIIVFGGILWRRANRYGAISGVVGAFSCYYILYFLNVGELQLIYEWDSAIFGWSMLTGFGLFFIVSRITKPESESRTTLFFEKMELLSDMDSIDADGKKPKADKHGKALILVDLPGWLKKERRKHFFTRYKEDFVGFFLAWVFVLLLILIAWLIMQL
ncbi:MAG: sodium:solute symporter family protein [Bacteroidota bacterium]